MTKIEQVARAIAACQAELGPERWRYCVTEARAAIEAMRGPTPGMLGAFWRQKNLGAQEIGGEGDDRSDYAAYNAMIDAALKEGE